MSANNGATVRGGRWAEAAKVAELSAGGLKAVRVEGRRLVIGRSGEGWFALDGRCPHEGYPLETGCLRGELLTCSWHNWKFDVRDGSCVVGGEPVRRYPVREEGGAILVDLADPPRDEEEARCLESLREALRRGDLGRAVRDAARALELPVAPRRLLQDVAADVARRGEWGPTHVLPLAADAVGVIEDGLVDEPARAAAVVLEMAVDAAARLPEHETPAPVEPGEGGLDGAFAAAVEDEDFPRAAGLLLGAVAEGAGPDELLGALWRACSLHFTDLGHGAVYLQKARRLLRGADRAVVEAVVVALARSLVYGTREDTLPYLRPYFARFEEDSAGATPAPEEDDGGEDLVAAALEAPRPADAVDALVRALRRGREPSQVARDLSAAAAYRLLRFDERIDADAGVVEGWLHATHRLTFASAVREAVDDGLPRETAERLLLQALAFVHSGAPLDAPRDRRRAPISGEEGDILAARRPALVERALRSPFVRPIYVAHGVKTMLAAVAEHRALAGRSDRGVPLQAAMRFLEADARERALDALVGRALAFVREGRMPRKLTQ